MIQYTDDKNITWIILPTKLLKDNYISYDGFLKMVYINGEPDEVECIPAGGLSFVQLDSIPHNDLCKLALGGHVKIE